MARRPKRNANFNEVHITNLDEDVDDLFSNTHSTPLKNQSSKLDVLSKQTNGVDVFTKYSGGFDSVIKREVRDPFKSTPQHEKQFTNNGFSTANADKSLTNSDSNSKTSGTTTLTSESVKQEVPNNDPLRMRVTNNDPLSMRVTPNKMATARSISQRSINDSQLSSRKTQRQRIDKNQKGYSHEEKDLVIDDIEDF